MRPLYTIAVLLLLATSGHTQAPYWQWARSSQGVNSVIQACCTDGQGNVYAAGFFFGTVSFGEDSVTDTDGPYQDVFIVKYDAYGNIKWVRSSNGYADAYGLSADDYGNVYLVGDFYSDSISFGSNVLVDPISGNSNIYLTKYDSSGNALWAKNLGSNTNDFASGVSADHSGNVYVTGYFTGDSLTLDNIVLHQSGTDNVFLAKFNSSGTAIWAHSEGCTGTDGPNAICTDSLGNVFITGYFSSLNMTFGAVTLASPFANNLFVTKYDSSGDVRWAKYFGGNNGNAATGLSADASGNVYLTGYFIDTILIGSNRLIGVGQQSIFIAKYDSSGILSWAQSAGGTNVDQANAISTDPIGNSYVTGYLQSDTVAFGADTLINPAGYPITFVAKYDPSGHVQWGMATTGGTTYNQAAGIAYSNGGVYVAGPFNGQMIIFGSDTLSASSSQGSFIARLDVSPTTGITSINNPPDRIKVYPNPAHESVSVAINTSTDSRITITLYDMIGNDVATVFSGYQGAGNYVHQTSTAGLASGTYLVKVSDGASTMVKLISVEH